MNTNRLLSALLAMVLLCPFTAMEANADNTHGIKTVVIDPGHGGKDPGALGYEGKVHEKDIVLSIAKQLGTKIKEAYPDVNVIYTRTGDKFIGLHERAMIARRNDADLFISIHCNGSNNKDAKGTSAHILGQKSKNKDNKVDYFQRNMTTAQRENSVITMEEDYQTKYKSYDPNSPETYISLQLLWQAFYQSSLMFAEDVIENLAVSPLQKRIDAVDQDVFHVLVAANMPAVLLELAFVTNKDEYKYLSSAEGQDEISTRLLNAFKSYKTKYDASFKVDENVILANAASKMEKINEEKKLNREFYGIQIMGLSRKLDTGDAALKGIDAEAIREENSSVYKYVYGKFPTFDAANAELKEVNEKFPGAFVVYVKNDHISRAK